MIVVGGSGPLERRHLRQNLRDFLGLHNHCRHAAVELLDRDILPIPEPDAIPVGAVIQSHECDLFARKDPQAGLQVEGDVLQPQARVILNADGCAAIPGLGQPDAARGEADGFIAFGLPRRA